MTNDERALLQSQLSRRTSGFRTVGKAVSLSAEWFKASLGIVLEQVPPPMRPRLVEALRLAAADSMSKATQALLASLVFQGVSDEPAKFLSDFMTFDAALRILDETELELATAPTPPAEKK